jgi:hypothetical protein
MAESSGYAETHHFDRLEELVIGLEDAMGKDGPILILVSVYQDSDTPSFPDRSMAEGWAELRNHLATAAWEGDR